MTALAFTAYGVKWFAVGMGRSFRDDPKPSAFMCIAFASISALGIVVFFNHARYDAPVGGLFIGPTTSAPGSTSRSRAVAEGLSGAARARAAKASCGSSSPTLGSPSSGRWPRHTSRNRPAGPDDARALESARTRTTALKCV
jgi:hypothetical protein